MANTAYILTFDRDDDLDYLELHTKITSLTEVLSWSHYIKSSYILITITPIAETLNEKLLLIFEGEKGFLLMEVDMKNNNGRLPPKAWDWIRNHER
jgi:hypothetical protein